MNDPQILNSNSDSRYDVLIIGAGIGGLITGNILQNNGYNVIILEKNDHEGGYFANFKRKQFNFDVNLHWTSGCEKGGVVYNTLKRFKGENCIEFIKLDEFYHWIDPQNNIDFHASTCLPEYIETLITYFPNDEIEIRNFFESYSNIYDPRVIEKLSGKKVSEIVDPNISSPILKDIMIGSLGFFGWPPNDLSALFMFGFSMMHFYQGAYYIKGGAGAFSNALAAIFKNNGGIIKYRENVTKINFNGNKLEGIFTKDENKTRKKYYSKVVIANNNPITLLSKLSLKEHVIREYVEKLKIRKPSLSAVNLYLGLDIDLNQHGISDYMIWSPINRNNPPEVLKKSLKKADYSKLPIGSITIYSNIDPDCCPEGKSIISVLCYAQYELFKKISHQKDEYISLKNKISEDLIDSISSIIKISDLKSHVEVMELATPITFEKYSNNYQGAIMGWQMTPKQFFLETIGQKTPIENLFLCGHWSCRTGGLPNVAKSADNASRLAMKYLKQVN